MLYTILCYHSEDVVCSWSKEEDAAVMQKLAAVQERFAKAGKLGPVARLLPTTAATTLRKDREPPIVLDGPFAETKEQLLGFYVLDCATLDEAVSAARDLRKANPTAVYEIRPIRLSRRASRGCTPACSSAKATRGGTSRVSRRMVCGAGSGRTRAGSCRVRLRWFRAGRSRPGTIGHRSDATIPSAAATPKAAAGSRWRPRPRHRA